MPLTDTHCHLTDDAFAEDVEAVILRAKNAGIDRILLACIDEADFSDICDLCRRYPDTCMPSIGIHPENMSRNLDRQMAEMFNLLKQHPEIRAIGEIGLDLHWDISRKEEQIHLLKEQIRWGAQYDLPLLLHVRDAMTDFIKVLQEMKTEADSQGKHLRGIMHCFSGSAEDAMVIRQCGEFYFGVGGTLTYKKSQVPEVVRAIGAKHIVLETDAPYLAPVPHRGHRNEPAYMADTARSLADVLHISIAEIERITQENAERLLIKY